MSQLTNIINKANMGPISENRINKGMALKRETVELNGKRMPLTVSFRQNKPADNRVTRMAVKTCKGTVNDENAETESEMESKTMAVKSKIPLKCQMNKKIKSRTLCQTSAEHSQEVLVSKGYTHVNRLNFRDMFQKFENIGSVDLAAINLVGPPFPTRSIEGPNDDTVFPDWIECLQSRKQNKETKFEKLKELELLVKQRLAETESENMYYKQQISVMRMDLDAREHQVKNLENKCYQNERINETHVKRVLQLEKNVKILERLMAEKQAQLEREQCLSEDKMNLVKQILNADNTNWELLKENRDAFYPITNSAVRQRAPSSGGIDSQASTQAPHQVLKRKSDYYLAHYATPVAINNGIASNTNKSSTPQEGQSHYPPPVVNPRHRRSLSSGNEKWIDHRPPGTIGLGTVMRPKIKNKKSVSNLKSADILNNASKYALTPHKADNRGQVETQVFNGEVIPSSSGGAQVIINDVENLKQGSHQARKRTISDTRLLSPQSAPNRAITEQEINHFSKRSRR